MREYRIVRNRLFVGSSNWRGEGDVNNRAYRRDRQR
jgi:hypothetical protein